MNKKLFNIATGIPVHLLRQVNAWRLELRWSRHAINAAIGDKYGPVPANKLQRMFTPEDWNIVEVESEHGYAQKAVVRQPLDDTYDLVLVILRESVTEGVVKTCWLNLSTDNHYTLDRSKFSKV